MFIKVTGLKGSTVLVNINNIICVVEQEGQVKIVYTDDSYLRINESIDEVEQILKGADDEHN